MKKLFLFAGLMVTVNATAGEINMNCQPVLVTGQNGGGSLTCPAFTLPSGVSGANVTQIIASTVFDFTYNFIVSPTASATYRFNIPGPHTLFRTINNVQRPDQQQVTLCGGGIECAAFLGGFTITGTYTGTAAVTGGTFGSLLTLDYAVPEPATFWLVGVVLAGAGLRRRRA